VLVLVEVLLVLIEDSLELLVETELVEIDEVDDVLEDVLFELLTLDTLVLDVLVEEALDELLVLVDDCSDCEELLQDVLD